MLGLWSESVIGGDGFWVRGGSGDTRTHTHLTHFQTDAVCIRLDDGPSFLRWYQLPALDWYPFVSRRLASRSSTPRVKETIVSPGSPTRPSGRLRLSRLPLSIPTEGRKGCRGKREKVSFMNKEMILFPCQTEFLHQVSEKSNGANSHMQIVVLISASDCFWSSLSSEAKMIDGTFTSNVQSEFIFRFHWNEWKCLDALHENLTTRRPYWVHLLKNETQQPEKKQKNSKVRNMRVTPTDWEVQIS